MNIVTNKKKEFIPLQSLEEVNYFTFGALTLLVGVSAHKKTCSINTHNFTPRETQPRL